MRNSTNRTFRPRHLAAAIALALAPQVAQATTYVVTSRLDNGGVDPAPGAGTGTLRQAIVDANANCASDPTPVIAFAVGASAAFAVEDPAPEGATPGPLPALQCGSYAPGGPKAAAPPAVTISPPNLAFGNVPINTTSPAMTVTLTSSGLSPYVPFNFGSPTCYGGPICYGGAEFACITDCIAGQPYSPGQACSITASFDPTFLGPQSVTIQFCDNTPTASQTITLSGTGVPPPPLDLTPSFFDFGNVAVGSRSAPSFFRLQNPGSSPVDYTITVDSPFALSASTCANPMPPLAACDLDILFAPLAAGPASGNLVVQASSGTPSIASLAGTGSVAPLLAIPSNVDVAYTLGGPPAAQRVTIGNGGLATLAITSISVSGAGFTLQNNCPASLPPGSSCDVVVGFSATDRGTYPGLITIVSNTPRGTDSITLRGLANPPAVPVLQVTPKEIGYGNLAFGKVSAGEIVKVENVGGAPAVFNSFVVSPDFVILSNTCTVPLSPLAACEVRVALRALSFGMRIGELVLRSNADNSPNAVAVSGTSCRGASLVIPRLGLAGGC